MDNRPIGIFDSGVGGLTVVSEFLKILPNEEIIYFGDTARVPYGSKSKQTIEKFSIQNVNFLLSKNVKAIVVACNTVSSNCYDELTARFSIPFVEVVEPGARECLRNTENNIVGVIGTERTIESGAYEKHLKTLNPNIQVYSKSCPLFVHLAEEGWVNNSVAASTAEIYLQELIDRDIDSLILGCTHYPLLTEVIKKTVGYVKIINPAKETALTMKNLLESRNLLNETSTETSHTFYVSDNTKKFNKICNLVLGKSYSATMIDIEKY